MANISYQSSNIAQYFSHNRVSWGQFYESERHVIEALNPNPTSKVLDIGCGCGGLGLALREEFGVTNYMGVDINIEAVDVGNKLNPGAILQGDILKLCETDLVERQFDVVFSLSCVDWNVEFDAMLQSAWDFVAPGGSLVATFRLTDEIGCRDMSSCYQYINYEGKREGDMAAYVVLNSGALIRNLIALNPSHIKFYGYWGKPSPSAVTPYDRLCFVACSISKRAEGDILPLTTSLHLPVEIRSQMIVELNAT